MLDTDWNLPLEWFRTNGDWVLRVFLVVFFSLLLNFVLRIILNKLHARLEKTHNPWDDSLVDALRKPLTSLVWIVGLSFAAEIIHRRTDDALFAAVPTLREIGVILCVTWFLIRFARNVEANIIAYAQAENRNVDHTTVDAIGKLVRISIFITSALVILQTLGFSISGVLAFGGIGGIAVGFAAKDLLANFFGGLMIYLDRPFTVGDWVRSPDRDIEGTVESIGWRLTCIRTFDKRPLYVPNATFTSIAVENPSRMSHRRIYETVGIRYADAASMRAITAQVKEMLQQHEEIDHTQTMIVNFNKFNASSLDFFVYTFTHTTNWIHYHEVKQDVLLKILDIVEANGAEVAFPTATVHIPDAVSLVQESAKPQT